MWLMRRVWWGTVETAQVADWMAGWMVGRRAILSGAATSTGSCWHS